MAQSQLKNLPIAQLRLDPDNPRFLTDIATADLEAFLPWFEQESDLLGVADSIATNGYFAGEPLLVAPGKDNRPGLVVVEGNRRYGAVLLLHEPKYLPRSVKLREMAQRAPLEGLNTLPCVEYSDRDEILDYLGNRHIVGVRQWEPLAKARYLRQLRDRAKAQGDPTDDRALASKIGSRSDYVRRLLNSLEAFERVEKRGIAKKDEARFSILQTALQYGEIQRYVGIDLQNEPEPEAINDDALDDVGRWTLQPDPAKKGNAPRVNSRRLPDLAKIVATPEARDAFREGATVEQALRLTGASAEALDEALQESIAAVAAARTHAQRLDTKPSDGHLAAYDDLRESVENLGGDLRGDHDDRAS